jgi:hypothetical protein
MEAPADGNHILFSNSATFGGANNVTSITIAPGITYTLTAAIGHDLVYADAGNWSIQLYADTNGNGALDGTHIDTVLSGQDPADPMQPASM